MSAKSKDHKHPDFAARIVKALPAALQKEAEVITKDETKPYTVIKLRGRSVASVRDGAIRIVHPHGCTADDTKRLAKMLADAAPEAKPEKPKAAKADAKSAAKDDAPEAGGEDGGDK